MEIEIYLSTSVVCNPPLLMLVVLLVLCPSLLMLVQPALALMVGAIGGGLVENKCFNYGFNLPATMSQNI